MSQVTGEVEAEEDNGDVDVLDETPEDTDEEYAPAAKPSSSAASPSTSKGQTGKAQRETSKNKNGADSKKDSVQCPICFKSFKSKYYLKVHNRYRMSAFFSFPNAVKRIRTNVSSPQATYRGETLWLPQMWEEVLQEGEPSNTRDERLC